MKNIQSFRVIRYCIDCSTDLFNEVIEEIIEVPGEHLAGIIDLEHNHQFNSTTEYLRAEGDKKEQEDPEYFARKMIESDCMEPHWGYVQVKDLGGSFILSPTHPLYNSPFEKSDYISKEEMWVLED